MTMQQLPAIGNWQLVSGPDGAPWLKNLATGVTNPFGTAGSGDDYVAYGASQWDQATAAFGPWATRQSAGEVEQAQIRQDYDAYQKQVAARLAANNAAGSAASPGAPAPSTPAGNGATAQASDSYAAFKTAFKQALGRDITEDEQNSNAFLATLDNWLFKQLPHDRIVGFALDRILQLPNEDLLPILRDSGVTDKGVAWQGWNLLAGMPAERFNTFDTDYLTKEALPFLDKSNPTLAAQVRTNRGLSGGTPPPAGSTTTPPAGGAGTPPPTTTPAPGTTKSPSVEIPSDHAWVTQIGAQQWYYDKVAAGLTPDKITTALLRQDMAALWDTRKADGTFDKRIYAAAQQYFAKTGWWPTEVELNQFTANLNDVPNLSPADGKTAIPKSAAGATAGAAEKWKVPTDPATGKEQPLPPGYEWRFSADGTPLPFDTDQTSKDLFSGWYMDPKTGNWSYNPLLGAADYLAPPGSNPTAWTDLIGGFIERTGRLPTKDEARALSTRLWSGADDATRQRAEQFAAANGFWPTPFELEYGPAKDDNANTSGGGTGAAGIGQVPVFVPGIGTVLTQGQPVGTGGAGPGGGFVFDPFQGIPGNVRPWVKEVLNGTISADQAPPELRDWINYSLAAFKQQLPTRTPAQLPDWGQPGPPSGDAAKAAAGAISAGASGSTAAPGAAAGAIAGAIGAATGASKQLDDTLGTASFLNAWRQAYPGQPAPTPVQMADVGFLSQVDPQLTQQLPTSVLKQFPLDKLALLPNEVLLQKVDLGTIAALPNERLLGLGQYKGSGFDLSVIAALPNERLLGVGKYAGAGFPPDVIASLPNERLLGTGQYQGSGFSSDDLAKLPMDDKRRAEINTALATQTTPPVQADLKTQVMPRPTTPAAPAPAPVVKAAPAAPAKPAPATPATPAPTANPAKPVPATDPTAVDTAATPREPGSRWQTGIKPAITPKSTPLPVPGAAAATKPPADTGALPTPPAPPQADGTKLGVLDSAQPLSLPTPPTSVTPSAGPGRQRRQGARDAQQQPQVLGAS